MTEQTSPRDNFFEFASLAELDSSLSKNIVSYLEQDIKDKGKATLAVSGGSTPKSLFQALSNFDIDWQKVTITLVDDRWVDKDHADSNEKLVRDFLLVNKAASAGFISLKTEHLIPALACDEVSARLKTIDSAFSAVVLGMGEDGHTASFFPKSSTLRDCLDLNSQALCRHAEPDDDPDQIIAKHRRITLSLRRLLNSKKIFLQITGEKKLEVYQRAFELALKNNTVTFPISAVLNKDEKLETYWTA